MGKRSRNKSKHRRNPKCVSNKWLLGGVFDEFKVSWFTPEAIAEIEESGGCVPDHVWRNDRYQVWVWEQNRTSQGELGKVTWLSIKRNDRKPIDVNHWRELQRIKNAICGPEREAVQLYPAESRLVDTSNQYHLFVLPEGKRLPFGYLRRHVITNPDQGAVQRPWLEKQPADAGDNAPSTEFSTK